MLQLNPKYRKSASDLLKQKSFEFLKSEILDKNCKIQVELDFDNNQIISDDMNKYIEEVRSKDVNTILYFKRKMLKELILFAR